MGGEIAQCSRAVVALEKTRARFPAPTWQFTSVTPVPGALTEDAERSFVGSSTRDFQRFLCLCPQRLVVIPKNAPDPVEAPGAPSPHGNMVHFTIKVALWILRLVQDLAVLSREGQLEQSCWPRQGSKFTGLPLAVSHLHRCKLKVPKVQSSQRGAIWLCA